MKNNHPTLFVAVGILIIGLLIFGIFYAREKSRSDLMNQQGTRKDSVLLEAGSISKETLLLLLAVGIAGVLGMSRRKKYGNTDANAPESNRLSNLQNASVNKRKHSATDST